MSEVTEFFEAISHPTRIKILKLLEGSPMSFSQLKKRLGIESSGNLDHHIKKLEKLVRTNGKGLYALSDDGKEALRAVRLIESSRRDNLYPLLQSRWALVALGIPLATFTLAVMLSAIPLTSVSSRWALIGAIGGLIGGAIGIVGAFLGIRAEIVAEGKSHLPLTYFPSQKMRWGSRDWALNILFLSSWLVLLFNLIYVQLFIPWGEAYLYKALWYTTSLTSLSTSFITAVMISRGIIVKANRIIEKLT